MYTLLQIISTYSILSLNNIYVAICTQSRIQSMPVRRLGYAHRPNLRTGMLWSIFTKINVPLIERDK
jgi:hypothetical protein